MTAVYDVVNQLKDFLYNHPIVNYVTFGDIRDVDLDKTTIFPLSHFNMTEASFAGNHITFNLSFLFLDIVDYTKDYEANMSFRDNSSNILDILNTQLQVANAVVSELRRGDLYTDKYQLDGEPLCRVFRDKYENQLAGWRVDLTIMVPNNISIC